MIENKENGGHEGLGNPEEKLSQEPPPLIPPKSEPKDDRKVGFLKALKWE